MSKKKSFALRINSDILKAVQRWADDDLRSLNGQIEFILRDSLLKAGRIRMTEKVILEVEDLTEKSSPSKE